MPAKNQEAKKIEVQRFGQQGFEEQGFQEQRLEEQRLLSFVKMLLPPVKSGGGALFYFDGILTILRQFRILTLLGAIHGR